VIRREFIAGAAALVAGIATGGLPSPAFGARPRLAPERLATYRRLRAALGAAPRRRFRTAARGDGFARWYAAQPQPMREHVDAVLDAARELLPAGRGYAALRDLPGGASPTPAQAHRRSVLMAAVAVIEGPRNANAPTEALA
jgi:hypothetical protein